MATEETPKDTLMQTSDDVWFHPLAPYIATGHGKHSTQQGF